MPFLFLYNNVRFSRAKAKMILQKKLLAAGLGRVIGLCPRQMSIKYNNFRNTYIISNKAGRHALFNVN